MVSKNSYLYINSNIIDDLKMYYNTTVYQVFWTLKT